MRKYEVILIIRPDLDKEGYEEIKAKLGSFVSKEKGQLKSWDVWKENHQLSYILRSRGADKRKYTQATYILSEFLFDPRSLGSLKHILDLEERILRYLIINKENK